jgi:uncharacterized protein (TIGR02145 family)
MNKKQITLNVALLLQILMGLAQPPALIPYQAIARDASGNALSNQNIGLRFSIHDQAISGTIVWQEAQTALSGPLGVIVTSLGSVSDLSSVNWANGAKFLQVEMDVTGGTNYTDIGTQQMMSVPYALYAGTSGQLTPTGASSVNVGSTSLLGDTLYTQNGGFIIIPGLSAANNGGLAATCGTPNVHNHNIEYGTITDTEGNTYKTVVIGNQEWMAENLNTSIYRNGDAIITGLSNGPWATTFSGAWAYYSDDASYACPHGKLYNWYACSDPRGVCPVGWHIPSSDEWNVLINFLGGPLAGGKMKSVGTLSSTGVWASPNTDATNSSGFSATPGGTRLSGAGGYSFWGYTGYWWSITEGNNDLSTFYTLGHDYASVGGANGDKHYGFSIRCLRD